MRKKHYLLFLFIFSFLFLSYGQNSKRELKTSKAPTATKLVRAKSDICTYPSNYRENVRGYVSLNDKNLGEKGTSINVRSFKYYDASGNQQIHSAGYDNVKIYGKNKDGNWEEVGFFELNFGGKYHLSPSISRNFVGETFVEYTIEHSNGDTDVATLEIKTYLSHQVDENSSPLAHNDTQIVESGKTVIVSLFSNDMDADGDPLKVTSAKLTNGFTVGNGGTANITLARQLYIYKGSKKIGRLIVNSNGTSTFRAESDFTGKVSFDYDISDGKGGTDIGTATITVLPENGINDVYANDDAYMSSFFEIIEGNIFANDNLEGGRPKLKVGNREITAETQVNSRYNYNPIYIKPDGSFWAPYAGSRQDYFEYEVIKGDRSDKSVVYLNWGSNGYPLRKNSINQTLQGIPVSGNLSLFHRANRVVLKSAKYYDATGTRQDLPFNVVKTIYGKNRNNQWMKAGTIQLKNNGEYDYLPDSKFIGDIPVDYIVSSTDENWSEPFLTSELSLEIKVFPNVKKNQNSQPIATNDTQGVDYDGVSIRLLANDFDFDGDPLTVIGAKLKKGFTFGEGGTSTIELGKKQMIYKGDRLVGSLMIKTNGEVLYNKERKNKYNGNILFDYTISDGKGGTDTGTVTLSVYYDPDSRVEIFLNDDAYFALSETPITGKIFYNDGLGKWMIVNSFEVNDVEVENPSTEVNIPNKGKLNIKKDGTFTFTPFRGFVGTVSFPYDICVSANSGDGRPTVPEAFKAPKTSNIQEMYMPYECYHAVLYITVLPPKQNYWYGTESTVWDVPNNWTAGVVPKVGQDVEFATAANNDGNPAIRDLHVPVGLVKKKEIGNLVNESSKSLIVPADAHLVIGGRVTGSSTMKNKFKIQVKAEKNKPNGTIIFKGQPCNTELYGTVQLYAKGFKGEKKTWVDNIVGSPTLGRRFNASYHWQFFGVPVESVVADPTFYGSFLREYDETFNGDIPNRYYQKWHPLNNNSTLRAWKGYEITQEAPKEYELKGKFQFCDKTIRLTRKAREVEGSTDTNMGNRHYGLGQNVFGNSYTSSINIEKMEFPPEVEKVVYLYNTGSFFSWAKHTINDQENSGVQVAGQYTAIPQNLASTIYDGRIPSMNGFLLRFTDAETVYGRPDATVKIKYGDEGVVPNTRPQTAAKKPISYLDVILSSKSTFDKVMLISEQGTSESFDNGWDGRKFFGTPTAFIYSETEDGPMQINTTENLHNKLISFYANNDKKYTLSLVKHNLDTYKDLSLLDLATKKVIRLTQDTTVYHFEAQKINQTTRRFKIVNSEDVDFGNPETVSLLDISYQNKKIVSNNYTSRNGVIEVFDIAGRLVMSKLLKVGTTTYSVNLSQGSYIVRVIADGRQNKLKIIVK